jgi:O-succinylbenzoic acid--CoA ligase
MFSLREAARERADSPAVVTTAGVLTFGDLWARVRPVARALNAAPTRRGGAVAVVAALRLETLLAIYALAELGIPMVLLHPRLTAAERSALVEASGAQLLLDESWTPPGQEADDQADDLPTPAVGDEEPLAILFTSGSSGSPKGVELSRRAFRASAIGSAANLGWKAEDRWLLCMPLGHVGGLSVVLRCLAARVPIVLSPWTGSLDGLLRDVDELGATLLSLVPTMLARILEEDPAYRFPSHVRAVLLGGDATSPALLAAAEARGVPVLTTYGMTEACSQIATLTPGERAAGSGVGRPLPGTEVRIVEGHIQARGPTLFTRYLPVGRFPSPFVDDGWFVTGDLGRLDDAGRLHVTGRSSDLIITGGENVDPREVEAALESCAGVRGACVFPLPDDRWGQIVVAALVLDGSVHGDAAAGVAAVSAEVRTKLARHKWPRRLAPCDAFVLNATGKLDRRSTATASRERLLDV